MSRSKVNIDILKAVFELRVVENKIRLYVYQEKVQYLSYIIRNHSGT